jgi:hypothetical protein
MSEALGGCQLTLMNENELLLIDGGGILGKALAGVGGCLLIAAGGVSIIVGVGLAVGTGGAATVPGIKLACSGAGTIVAGCKVLDEITK